MELKKYWEDNKHYVVFAVGSSILILAVLVSLASGFVETGITG